MDGLGCACRCHPKWRQIERCGQANFGNSSGDHDLPPDILSTISYGGKIVTALEGAIRKTQLLTLLQQLYPLLIRVNLNVNVYGDDVTLGSPKAKCLQGTLFLQDLHQLLTWPSPKNRVETGDADGKNIPITDERRQGSILEGMSHPHKKLAIYLKKDKSRRKFFQELLSTPIIANVGVSDTMSSPEKTLVIKLLKKGLSTRYSSHIRKAIKDLDSQSVLCILSIVANSEIPLEARTHGKEIGKVISNETQDYSKSLGNLENNKVKDNQVTFLASYDRNDTEYDDSDDTTCVSWANLCSTIYDVTSEKVETKPKSTQDNFGKEKDILNSLQLEDLDFVKILRRVFNFQSISKMSQTINQQIDNLEKGCLKNFETANKSENAQFLGELKRLKNLVIFVRQKSLNRPSTLLCSEQRKIAKLHQQDSDFSKIIQNFENILKERREKYETTLALMNKEISAVEEALQKTRIENESLVLERVKQLEMECKLQEKYHQTKVKTLDVRVNTVENKLTQVINTLESGHKGLRSYRKRKESELRQLIYNNKETITEHKKVLRQLKKLENVNDNEISRLKETLIGMEDQYEEMKNTRRLKELLANLQMAEAVKENWAARRIQAAWKRYKVRKLRKRRIKKPRKKRKDVESITTPNSKEKNVPKKPLVRKKSKVSNISDAKKGK